MDTAKLCVVIMVVLSCLRTGFISGDTRSLRGRAGSVWA